MAKGRYWTPADPTGAAASWWGADGRASTPTSSPATSPTSPKPPRFTPTPTCAATVVWWWCGPMTPRKFTGALRPGVARWGAMAGRLKRPANGCSTLPMAGWLMRLLAPMPMVAKAKPGCGCWIPTMSPSRPRGQTHPPWESSTVRPPPPSAQGRIHPSSPSTPYRRP